ncbi:MAG: MlaD family protein [Ignavibacteriota bacterium]
MNLEAKVGAFVMGCVLVLAVTVYSVTNEQWGSHLTSYRTYLHYAGGIAPGTEVLFGGISVGRVTAVRSWSQDPTQIEITMDLKEGTPVNAKSVASLGAVSLMASPAVSITTGTREAQRLAAGSAIASQETVSFDDMAENSPGLQTTPTS